MENKIIDLNDEGEHIRETEVVEVVASYLGMMPDQVLELRKRLQSVRFDDDGGFGVVQVEYRSRKVYRLSHKVNGRPRVFSSSSKDGE